MISRLISRPVGSSSKSFLLLGPRQTGKSTFVASLKPDLTINLMHEPTFLTFAGNPSELEQRLQASRKAGHHLIFIDEVQRLPSLLNTLQVILDSQPRQFRFALTGSSARKLRRGNANLLPGRVISHYLGPVVSREMGYELDAQEVLSTGTLPGVLTDSEPESRLAILRSYAGTYLKEEIQAESLTRNLEGFARFLHVAAEWSGHFLDISKMAAAAQVSRQTAIRFFEILEDCLVVHRVESFSRSMTRRLVQHPKFYFFDVGVVNGLLGNFQVSLDRIGWLFEHLVCTQILHSIRSLDREVRVSTFRTEHGAEVDLVLEETGKITALELKASRNVGSSDVRGLNRFGEYLGRKHRALILYLGTARKSIGPVDVLPWQEGLQELGF